MSGAILRTARSQQAAPGSRPIPRLAARPRLPARPAGPHLYLAVFGSWLLALAWFHPRMASLLDLAHTPAAWLALAFFVAFTELAWLYAFFNLGVVVFAAVHRRLAPVPPPPVPAVLPPVALLYTTCNDFVEESALSCVRQDYPHFTVYLLDDSSDPIHRARVDRFAARHPAGVQVVRRPDRRGFKAGNINHALARATAGEPLFALADADEVLPPHFLRRTAAHLLADESRGFVQASHVCNPRQRGALASTLGAGIGSHWRWYQPLRNRWGFVMLLGHGALLRREAWEAVGGFPELVSEDLAFALRIREKGWRGWFAEDVVCYEDFPETMRDFRVRHMKWTRGTCEFLHREMPRALRSGNIPLAEKLDVLFPTLNLPLSLVWFLFILDASVLLAAHFGVEQPLTLALGSSEVVLRSIGLDPGFRAIQGADFYAITVLTLLAPVLCFVADQWRTPLRLLRFLAQSTAVYGALGPLSTVGVSLYALTGKAVFHVTADRSRTAAVAGADGGGRLRERLSRLLAGSHPDQAAVKAFEFGCATFFAALGLYLLQLPLLGMAVGFAVHPIAHHLGWESRTLRAVAWLPGLLIGGGMALGGLALFGMQTVLFGFGFHF